MARRDRRNQEILDCLRRGITPPSRPQVVVKTVGIDVDDIAVIRSVKTGGGGWKRQSVATRVREGKLPPECLEDFADLTDSPAEDDDEKGSEAQRHTHDE